jgi:hypothetical protein
VQREAAEITEQAMVTGSEGTGEGVSHAAAVDADAASEVEPSGHFRIYLGAALVLARPTPCSARDIAGAEGAGVAVRCRRVR